MATITSEVFRFVNLRPPANLVNETTTPTLPTPIKANARVMVKPEVITQAKWDDTLVQKLTIAKHNPENEDDKLGAMMAVLSDFKDTSDLANGNLYLEDEGMKNVFEQIDWIHQNQNALEKEDLKSKIKTLLVFDSEYDPEDSYADIINSANFVETELMMWDILIATSILGYSSLSVGISQLLNVLFLAKELNNAGDFIDSEEIYAIFTAPIELPKDIFPLPSMFVGVSTPEPDPRDEQLATAKEELTKWQATLQTTEFVREQIIEDQTKLVSEFILEYDEEGSPSNLNDRPALDTQYLTKEILLEYIAKRCATSMEDILTTGGELLTTYFLCSGTAKYSYEYLFREINKEIGKQARRVSTLMPYSVQKTVVVDGTIFNYKEEIRGSL